MGYTKMMARAPECHPERKHKGRGLCPACYDAARRGRPPKYTKRYPGEELLPWILNQCSPPDPQTGCRIWKRSFNGTGRAMMTCSKYGKRKEMVSRVVWMEMYGPIPKGKEVCHTCDDGRCCESSHFFLGTHDENMKDAGRKGRMPRGSKHWRSKLTEA